MPILKEHYIIESKQRFTEINELKDIEQYIQYASEQLSKETQFLNKFWSVNKRSAPNKSFVLKELYEILVIQYKQQMY
jgi:hypothetical protein